MPYPRYGGGSSGTGAGSGYGSGSYGGRSGSSSSYHGGVSPWAGSGGGAGLHGATPKVDPVALVGNLVGAMMGAGGSGGNPLQQLAGIAMASAAMGPSGQDRSRGYERDRRDRQQRRERSPPRRNFRSRSRERRGDRQHSRHSGGRRERSPEPRAEHEIYIGNYPVRFRESDVRKLFEDHNIKVDAIRLKHDGLKVFGFAETESLEMVEKAKSEMEGVEIQGRKLRVRSSKDTDKKKREERDDRRQPKPAKSPPRVAPLKKEDVTKHLVNAFVSFIDRELASEQDDQPEFKGLLEAAKTALSTAYNLPEDESLKMPRNLEDIFFRDVRNDIKLTKIEIKVEVPEDTETMDDDVDEDDDGNWKRRARSKELEEDKINANVEDTEVKYEDHKICRSDLNVTATTNEQTLPNCQEESKDIEIDDGNIELENDIALEDRF